MWKLLSRESFGMPDGERNPLGFIRSFIPLFPSPLQRENAPRQVWESCRNSSEMPRWGSTGEGLKAPQSSCVWSLGLKASRSKLRPSREGRLQHPTSCGPRRLLEISIKLPLKTPAFQEAMDMEQPLGGRKQSFRQEESTTAPGEDGSFPQQGKGYSGAARGHLHLFQPLSSPLPSAIQWHRHHRVHCGQSWLLQGPRSLLRGDRKPRGHPRTPLTTDSPSEVLPSVFPEAELGLLVLLAPQKLISERVPVNPK